MHQEGHRFVGVWGIILISPVRYPVDLQNVGIRGGDRVRFERIPVFGD